VVDEHCNARRRFAISLICELDIDFKSFSQVDSSITRNFGETGLGLSISRQLVELMGGVIGVRSQVGAGSVFWFEIPVEIVHEHSPSKSVVSIQDDDNANARALVRRHAVLADTTTPIAVEHNTTLPLIVSLDATIASNNQKIKGKILVAEDNRINQLFIAGLLKQFGCAFDLVDNGEQAVAAVEQRQYDLILMDCQMPEMDGLTATREIRVRESTGLLSGKVPIIALTANAIKGDRERCIEAGMNDYITKPIDSNRLRIAMSDFLCNVDKQNVPVAGNA